MMGEDGMVTYKINKKRGHHKMIGYPAFKSDRLKKKRKKRKEVRKWQERIKQKERIEENKTTGWRVSPWSSRTPCFLSWISGVTKENTKTG
jgi:hypothetical protein